MTVAFAFGREGLRWEIGDKPGWEVLETRWPAALEAPAAEIAAACAPLTGLAQGRRSAAVSICDITRPAPNRLTLPPVLAAIEAAGIAREAIVILIATGLHRPATPAEIAAIVGPDIAARYRVENHFARDLAAHRELGRTAAETPIWIDRRWLDADLHVTLGFTEPHLMAGFSGGRKLIVPGLAGEPTIKTIHSPHFMRDPRAVEASIDDNPLDRELWEIAARAGHDFVLDVVLTAGRRVAGVFAGAPRAAHAAGVAFVRRNMAVPVTEPFDAAVTTSAGYPLDLTFYQTVKGVTAAAHIVKPGGTIVILSACPEGCGAPEFSTMVREAPAPAEFLRQIENREVVVDQWQMEKLALVARDRRIVWYTPGLPPEYHAKVWGRVVATPEEAFAAVAALPRVALIPEGPYTLAQPAW
jgi:nickel-dependent lactate racemase